MTAPPSSSARMDWYGTNAPRPYPYHAPSSYDAYNPPHGPPLTPGSYHPGAGGYSPHRPSGPPPRIHPPKYLHEQQQQQQHQQQQRHPPQHYGQPYDGPATSPYHVEGGRQGPPPPGYDYYSSRREMYQPPMLPPYHTPPPHLRRRGSDSASVTNSASFSSKEETPEVERTIPPKSSDWEPTRSTTGKGEKGKKQGDPLSLLAKVAMEPSRSDQSSKESTKNVKSSKETDKADEGGTVTSPSKDESEEPLHSQLRSSPIVAPNSVVKPPPPSTYRETSYQPPSTTNITAPKPITPTGVTHYGQPPPSSLPSAYPPPHRPNISRVNNSGAPYGPYDDRGPYPPPYGGMTPPHGPAALNYGPPPPGTYLSGYDSRSGSWEQTYVPPPNPPPAVVEERNSFDSYESSGTSRGSSSHHYHYYPSDFSRDPRDPHGYPTYPPSHGSAWQHLPPPDPRTGGYPPYPGWGQGGYEQPPLSHQSYPPLGYPTPPPHHMTPPRRMGGPPPTPPYYDERSSTSSYPQHHIIVPSPYGGGPPIPMSHQRPPYSYMHPPTREEKTILRKKFSWKHFPELERFLIENRDDYLKYSSRNYTVEQKQFNNTLTERLIVLAEKHGYVFDPEEFNFVAIRDRVRCYYKSYVQTARKRGLMLPTDKSPSALTANAVARHGGMDEDDESESNYEEHDAEEGVEVDENGIPASSSTQSTGSTVDIPAPSKSNEEIRE